MGNTYEENAAGSSRGPAEVTERMMEISQTSGNEGRELKLTG